MKQIICSGLPYEIGWTHGQESKEEVRRSIHLYSDLFLEKSALSWAQVQELARDFDQSISIRWPRDLNKYPLGVADGAERDILDIIALNVRSEIVFGRFSDGCTSVYWKENEQVYIGQNWDWVQQQQENLIQISIIQDGLPSIMMVTEAGIIGKIGLNSDGVGVCFNAIRAKGVDKSFLPVHLGLRMALESKTALAAAEELERIGMASSAHIMVGDKATAFGLEFTSTTFARLPVSSDGYLIHSNHMLLKHENIHEPKWLEDSYTRIQTMEQNILQRKNLSHESF
ncbi:uncharacterized protein N7469_005147, partial [Penicillium citrinum]